MNQLNPSVKKKKTVINSKLHMPLLWFPSHHGQELMTENVWAYALIMQDQNAFKYASLISD